MSAVRVSVDLTLESATPFFEYVHPEFAFQITRLGRLGIIVWNGEPPNDRVFEDHCVVVSDSVREHGAFSVFLNVAGSFAPSAAQRRIVAEYSEAMQLKAIGRIAIITDSALARGALLVLTWLTRARTIEIVGFRASEKHSALGWLAEHDADAVDVTAAIDACSRAEKHFRDACTAVG